MLFLGSTAEITRYGVADLFGKDFSFSQLKVIFPTAPLRPYTPLNGEFSNVWFDRYAITASVSEHLSTVEDIGETVKDLIKEENNLGIPNNRIVVG